MSADTRTRSPYILARAEVRAVDRVSPNFVRITFGGVELDDFGTPGDTQDARIKLAFPPATGILPDIDRDTDDWWGAYLAVPEAERGSMRTYSVRDLRVTDAGTEVVVDFVLHLAPGLTGPASLWASTASVGDELWIVGPRRGREDRSGIEYAPGAASRVCLVGDETAAPAIARILEDAPRDLGGVAFIEVPVAEDVLPIDAPAGVEVHWLPRGGAAHGLRLLPTVLDYLGDTGHSEITVQDAEGEDLVWETPVYSGSGEKIAPSAAHADRYFWIAGESGVVTTLRRHLVKDLGIDRSQVAFMGYWRRGVSMRG
ncbi:NADPH-dependent ferric siderophore reductase [Microbacterium ginsengiterrae]|uniref:NADPH-dependent ferric siderophore reductase n=1 Tax=Microbacterium ginsengiterrae TaxID=546115 RepID=A0A7W9CC89_9MICO|nr:siderophore-interacting protein [Microbacterium ginsengiterrae]MBB5742940.1 NADPH-dependent ferric siderophore reductase [Microbacterium ginsengiterrae]